MVSDANRKIPIVWAHTKEETGKFEFQKLPPWRYAAFVLSGNGFRWLGSPIVFYVADEDSQIQLKTLSLNMWFEGTMIPDGFNAIVYEIIYSGADIVILSEVENYNGDFMQLLADAMYLKGFNFWTYHSVGGIGVLSRFPIKNHIQFEDLTKYIININDEVTVALYACHLDQNHFAAFLPRGYEFSNGKLSKLDKPVTDVETILNESYKSRRPSSIKAVLKDAKNEMKNGNCNGIWRF